MQNPNPISSAQSHSTAHSDDAAIPHADHDGDEIRCPMCDYNLRGLIDPRCPECGYTFEWTELRDPARRLHPYLFEHHPERNLNAFRRTLFGGFRPRRFWTSLHPAQPARTRRIVAYWCLAASLVFAAMLTSLTQTALYMAAQNVPLAANPNRFIADSYLQAQLIRYGSLQAYLDAELPTTLIGAMCCALASPQCSFFIVVPCVVPLLWPWLTCITLMIFPISMGRARVDRIHVLRCVLYSFDVVIWLGLTQLLMTINTWVAAAGGPPPAPLFLSMAWTRFALIAPILLYGLFRLWVAYRLYLRFSHPFATVVTSQIIVTLFTLAVLGAVYIP